MLISENIRGNFYGVIFVVCQTHLKYVGVGILFNRIFKKAITESRIGFINVCNKQIMEKFAKKIWLIKYLAEFNNFLTR